MIIARYGGTVEKFIGDAVMAMWGAPIAHEDDAERAVRAAVELVAAVAAVGGRSACHGSPPGLGSSAARRRSPSGAVGQGMVAGDVVNTASRLQAAARPGTVLVDEATYRAVRGSIAFERAGDRTLRGKRLPVPAWEARQVVALVAVARVGASCPRDRWSGATARSPSSRTSSRPSARSARPGSCRSSVRPGWARAGSPGRSRSTSTASSRRSRWHHARSPAYGEGLAFWALAEMVR